MKANAVIRARIDEQTKQEASAVLAATGLSVSDAIRLFMVRIATEKALPFDPLVPNEATVTVMREARAGQLKRLDTVEALMTDLHQDADFSDAKPATEIDHLNRLRAEKARITIYLDSEVIEAFKTEAQRQGRGYQTIINEALRVYLDQSAPTIVTNEATLRRIIQEALRESA